MTKMDDVFLVCKKGSVPFRNSVKALSGTCVRNYLDFFLISCGPLSFSKAQFSHLKYGGSSVLSRHSCEGYRR